VTLSACTDPPQREILNRCVCWHLGWRARSMAVGVVEETTSALGSGWRAKKPIGVSGRNADRRVAVVACRRSVWAETAPQTSA
jgi:hypothetical protein